MSGFLRKVAGAFVDFEEDPSGGGPKRPGASGLDDITAGASDLLAQLEGIQADESGAGGASSHSAGAAGAGAGAGLSGTTGGTMPGVPVPGAVAGAGGGVPGASQIPLEDSAVSMTAQEVFQLSGLVDGPNSASRVLKIIAGLAMFPPEQQLVMVRAMDAADDTWSEAEVLSDARARQAALRNHLQTLQTERDSRIQSVEDRLQATRQQGQQVLEDIDRQIAELQKRRETAIADTTHSVDLLEQERQQIEGQVESARHGITHVINALSSLLTFFAGGGKDVPPPQ